MRIFIIALCAGSIVLSAQAPPNGTTVEAETLRHFQALVKFDTSDPPGAKRRPPST